MVVNLKRGLELHEQFIELLEKLSETQEVNYSLLFPNLGAACIERKGYFTT